eukprot:COSAG02_NODE_980_length_15492_cov_12.941727_2_plen_89_part_00
MADRHVGGKFRRMFRGSVLQELRDLRVPSLASASACDRVDGMSFLPHLRVCAPDRRENVLRLQEPKNEQKRLKEQETRTPHHAAEDWK